MTSTYSAWRVSRYGGPEVLTPVKRPLASPTSTEVLLRIHASAVSRADSMMRAGLPKFARLFLGLKRPRAGLAGTCFSGEVVEVGDAVTRFKVGDAVFGEAGLQFGANASHICLQQDASLLKKPDALSYEDAATLFDGAMTSWHFLAHVAQLQPGDTVLVLGGSGSLGSAAIQFAKALGATVSASASARNLDLLRSLGADIVIDYTEKDPLQTGAVYDVVFDTLGVSSFGAAKPALKTSGRYLCPVLSLKLLRDMVFSRFFGSKTAQFAAAGMSKPQVHREELAEILELIEQNQFSPMIDRSYPLSDLVEAHRYVETGRKRGNVVVV
ncbi:MAG: NAD(P)-dependent alcohol dehydrogenase [Pseudomonadota bacterium]